ncbi:uncharacterized protein KD926_006689 [Aspergillus affinis]|uniref:uncharacterized protein n=1 Tax=Aspergillus affinis TaxID=1070780 RepID=UPI0022FDC426|nr:uncharacterized protein KD926_006689 [Aspergillus affinis]KAI9041615.1 hypothetical protein KD926_006689 [Aspergillus affinis]
MVPFRNFLAKRSAAPNGGETDSDTNLNNGHLSAENTSSTAVNTRKSSDEPPEYKLSGMFSTMRTDISARSPVSYSDAMPSRTSLDSRFSRMTSPSRAHSGFDRKPESMEEEFEDVGLEDEEAKPKKKGIFSRLGDLTGDSQTSSSNSKSSHLGFHIPGRKRGQSNVGSELGSMKTPPPGAEAAEVREG